MNWIAPSEKDSSIEILEKRLPCTFGFLDKSNFCSSRREEAQIRAGKGNQSFVTSAATNGMNRADTLLFIDARHIYRQADRAYREWTPAQIGFLANRVHLYRGEARTMIWDLFGLGSAGGPPAGFGGSPKPSSRQTKASGMPPNAAPGPGEVPIRLCTINCEVECEAADARFFLSKENSHNTIQDFLTGLLTEEKLPDFLAKNSPATQPPCPMLTPKGDAT
jgi:hypothetical protein